MRVATFNIRHGRGLDDRVDLERTAAAIRATGADLVALQELDRNFERSGDVDQPAVLAELTGLHIAFRPTLSRGDREYGIALATTGEVEVDYQPFVRAANEETRGLLTAHWRGITVVATHLSTQRDPCSHQIQALAGLLARLEPPVVLLGDLNRGRYGLRPLVRVGLTSWARTPGTFAYVRQIDHIAAGRGARVGHACTVPSAASEDRKSVV